MVRIFAEETPTSAGEVHIFAEDGHLPILNLRNTSLHRLLTSDFNAYSTTIEFGIQTAPARALSG